MWPKAGEIDTYGIFYGMGILAHAGLTWWYSRKLHLPLRVALAVGLSYLVGMSAGAVMLYDAVNHQFSPYRYFFIERYLSGGMWGGVLAYLALATPLALLLAQDRRSGLDLVVLPLPAAMMLAKTACFANGCCYGDECHLPWAVTFPKGLILEGGTPRHPTQIYEILVLAVIAGVFIVINTERWKGSLLFWFLALYGAGRPITETFRGDLVAGAAVGPLSASQILLLGAAGASVVIIVLYHSFYASLSIGRLQLRPLWAPDTASDGDCAERESGRTHQDNIEDAQPEGASTTTGEET